MTSLTSAGHHSNSSRRRAVGVFSVGATPPKQTFCLFSILRSRGSARLKVFLFFYLLNPVTFFSFSSDRPASEYSSPGRPLSCLVDENTPIMTPNGAAGVQGGDLRVQERRVRSQRHRNYMSRTHLHTPPDLPEGYGGYRLHFHPSIHTRH